MRGVPSQGRNIQTNNRAVTYGSAIPDGEIWFSAQEETASDGATLTTISNQGTGNSDATATSGSTTFNTDGGVQNNQPYYDINDGGFEYSISDTSPNGFAIYLVYSNKNGPPDSGKDTQFSFSDVDSEHWPNANTNFYFETGTTSRYVDGVGGNGTTSTNVVKIIADGSEITAKQNTGGSTLDLGSTSESNYSFIDPLLIGVDVNIELYELIFYTVYPSSSVRESVDEYVNGNYNTSL